VRGVYAITRPLPTTMVSSCYYARIVQRDSSGGYPMGHRQESQNERVAAALRSLWPVRCGARSFRRPPGGGSFRPVCPRWRSPENTFLCVGSPPLNAFVQPETRNQPRLPPMGLRLFASKSLSDNGQGEQTERVPLSLPRRCVRSH